MEGVLWQSPEMEEFGSCSIPTGAVSATFGIRTEYVARATHSTMGVLLGRASVCDNGEVLLIASSPNGRYFNTRYPADRTVQFLVQPAMWPMVEWLPCPSHALPSTAVQCGWDRMACKPLYAGKSLKTERYQHIGVVDEDLTLNVPVGTGQQPVRHFECEMLDKILESLPVDKVHVFGAWGLRLQGHMWHAAAVPCQHISGWEYEGCM